MRLGIFGGTFDPPHNGHLLVATDAAEALSLDVVWFVPNATQPLKGAGHGSAHQRLEMVALMASDRDRFGVDPIEVDRAGLSYTVDTLRAFEERFPRATRYLLIGADVTGSFDRWREPDRVRELAEIVILARSIAANGGVQDAPESAALRDARRLPTRRIDISSTEVRDRVRLGLPIQGFVPDAVAAYIAATGLYR